MTNAMAVARVATWASIECLKQRSGERSVGCMVAGWAYAYEHQDEWPTVEHMLRLANLVEPRHNSGRNFRSVDVMVGTDFKPPWQEVDRLMENLAAEAKLIEPFSKEDDERHVDAWYREYEEVHPLRDGNGRTGTILWNWLRGSLHPDKLDFPPDYWGYGRLEMPENVIPEPIDWSSTP